MDTHDGRRAVYNYLISNKREWNNCFIKNTQRNTSKSATIIVKKMRTPTTFVVHGIQYMPILLLSLNQWKFRNCNIQ